MVLLFIHKKTSLPSKFIQLSQPTKIYLGAILVLTSQRHEMY